MGNGRSLQFETPIFASVSVETGPIMKRKVKLMSEFQQVNA